jgi:glucose/arabinose dehydrogenase/mono/diheme cytochrome c family protein
MANGTPVRHYGLWLALVCLLGALPALAQKGDRRREKQAPLPAHLTAPPSPARAAEEELGSFVVADGFRVELFAGEPLVEAPVALAFDPDGRLWVVEMRGYMRNLEADGEAEPTGRVVILADTDGDGRADQRTVFREGLVMPRSLALVKGGALVVAARQLWFAPDRDGDGRAEELVSVDPDYTLGRNPEHQANGLLRGLDNWFYNAKSQFRYRLVAGEWVKEKTEFRGQWGITQDDFGRLFYNVNDSQLRGDLTPPGYISRNTNHLAGAGINLAVATNQQLFPRRLNTGVNRAYRAGVLDAQGRLREFTSACAPLIYRGDQFPPEFRGNAFVCEPAANLIKRNLVFDHGLALTAAPAYTNTEFLASTDERFRPVNLAIGPDGALYVADMYRGIIQHRDYMTTHLRREIVARGLDQPVHLGRIWRITPANARPGPPPRLARAGAAELLAALSHPNGWWRDTAQRLLVERGDASTIPALTDLALRATNPAVRAHALWTIEGLGGSAAFGPLLAALRDPHPRAQTAAVRVLESLAANAAPLQAQLLARLAALAPAACPEAQFQIALTAGNLPKPDALPLLAELFTRNAETLLMREAVLSGLQNWEARFLELLWREPRWREPTPGRTAALHALAGAILKERNSAAIEALLARLDRPAERDGWRGRALLAGITAGGGSAALAPIRLRAEPPAVRALAKSRDRDQRATAAALRQILAWPGHEPKRAVARPATPLTAEERELFTLGREQYLAVCYACHGLNGEGIVPLAPPLVNSAWVLGPERRLVRIVLHGLEGPVRVNGTRYEPPLALEAMPALESLDDEKVAAVLTYLRRAWGHGAKAVTPALVAQVRRETAQRQRPWTEEELEEIR